MKNGPLEANSRSASQEIPHPFIMGPEVSLPDTGSSY